MDIVPFVYTRILIGIIIIISKIIMALITTVVVIMFMHNNYYSSSTWKLEQTNTWNKQMIWPV